MGRGVEGEKGKVCAPVAGDSFFRVRREEETYAYIRAAPTCISRERDEYSYMSANFVF